jgi:hypothetical protein
MNWIPDLVRMGLRVKYRRTGKWSKTDHLISTVMPRSPMSAGMWAARELYEGQRGTVPAINDAVAGDNIAPSPDYAERHHIPDERTRQMRGLGIDEEALEAGDDGIGF